MMPPSDDDGPFWKDEGKAEAETVSWTTNNNHQVAGETSEANNKMTNASSLSTFKSMLDSNCYHYHQQPHFQLQSFPNLPPNPHQDFLNSFCSNPIDDTATNNLLLHAPLDSSTSCSPSPAFPLDPSHSNSNSFFPSLFNYNPFDPSFDLASCDPTTTSPFLFGFTSALTSHSPSAIPHELISSSSGNNDGFAPIVGFQGSPSIISSALFPNRSNILMSPLEICPPVGAAQPTLFQKRAALRQTSSDAFVMGEWGNADSVTGMDKKRTRYDDEDDGEEGTVDVSGLNYDSEEDEPISEKWKAGLRHGLWVLWVLNLGLGCVFGNHRRWRKETRRDEVWGCDLDLGVRFWLSPEMEAAMEEREMKFVIGCGFH